MRWPLYNDSVSADRLSQAYVFVQSARTLLFSSIYSVMIKNSASEKRGHWSDCTDVQADLSRSACAVSILY